MKYDFVEIGTADFETVCNDQNNLIGLSIEPVRYYFDKLNTGPNSKKLNLAIGDENKTVTMYWVHPDDFTSYNIEGWVRGGSSVNKLNWSTERELKTKNALDAVRTQSVEMITWKTLCERYEITEVDFLKIDAEGYDCIIVNNVLDTNEVLPKRIFYEQNDLTSNELIASTAQRLTQFGYKQIRNDLNSEWVYEV